MNVIILSGGSGSRLWPLSNEARSKQFLKIYEKEDGSKESMTQRMCRMIKEVDPNAKTVIATSESQVQQIKAQLGDEIKISIEPCRRDTFPAIALACAFLSKAGLDRNEPVVICPVDPYVEKEYFECLLKMSAEAKQGKANINLMGITPNHPATGYGYIIPMDTEEISKVKEFKEKPTEKKAIEYISQGALWNGGVFALKLGYILDIAKKNFGTNEYCELQEKYSSLKKISFDYAVVEEEKNINVVRFNGTWKDIGTWETLTETLPNKMQGNVKALDCDNTHVINQTNKPLVAIGINNSIIAATPDGILISDKRQASKVKELIDEKRPMYEQRVWGEYKVIDYKVQEDNTKSLVKELIIKPGKSISYQYHNKRYEIWTITNGEGEVILNGDRTKVSIGDTIKIAPKVKHSITAISELHIIEVQLGEELSEEDIVREQ